MDLALPIDQMTTAEKLRALEAIWESLCRKPDDVPSPSWHADVLRRREKSVQDGSSQFTDWVEAKQNLRDAKK
jgi:hypothetical protein